jgi:hypothetical protein
MFYAARTTLLRLGVGRTLLSLSEAASSYEQAIGLIASREDVRLVVRGPNRQADNEAIPRLHREGMARMAELDRRIHDACRRRRVPYVNMMGLTADDPDRFLMHDRLHANAELRSLGVEHELQLLRPLLVRSA